MNEVKTLSRQRSWRCSRQPTPCSSRSRKDTIFFSKIRKIVFSFFLDSLAVQLSIQYSDARLVFVNINLSHTEASMRGVFFGRDAFGEKISRQVALVLTTDRYPGPESQLYKHQRPGCGDNVAAAQSH